MICKSCHTENPKEAVFCMQCGKRLETKITCPSCGTTCPAESVFCLRCGRRVVPFRPENGETPVQRAQQEPQPEASPAQKEKKSVFELVRSAFDLSGGICLMIAVLFAFIFTLCMGLTASATVTVSSSGLTTSVSETTMLWDYFGSVYQDLAKSLNGMTSYTSYYEAARYIPVVLSTAVCAVTLVCVLVFTIISAVKYGKHFKNPELNYVKPAVAAILSFVIGATAFLAINSTSFNLSTSSSMEISIGYSGATLAGVILCGIFLGMHFASKIVILGKDFMQKQTVVSFVCTLAGVVCLILVTEFAKSPAVVLNITDGAGTQVFESGISFFNANLLISAAFSPDRTTGAMPENFNATYVCSTLAQFVQIALLFMVFGVFLEKIVGFGGKEKTKSDLGLSIVLFALAAVYLVLTCLALHFGTELISGTASAEGIALSIAAAPIVALIFSAFTLADSITQKVLIGKFETQK